MLQSALDDVKRMNKRQVSLSGLKSDRNRAFPSLETICRLRFLPALGVFAHCFFFILQFLYQVLSFGMIVSSALMIWKGLMVVTGSESPIVVVLRSGKTFVFISTCMFTT
jgi:hypothetical protein